MLKFRQNLIFHCGGLEDARPACNIIVSLSAVLYSLHDGEDPVPPPLSLNNADPLVIHDGVPVYGKDGRVPVSDPGHRVVPHLVDPAG